MNQPLSHRSIITLVVLYLFFQFPRSAFSGELAPRLELTLLVYTYTDFSIYQTKKIRERVAFIFANAGIRINWLDCSQGSEDQRSVFFRGARQTPSDVSVNPAQDRGINPLVGPAKPPSPRERKVREHISEW
jgi:hypothetical protein